MSSFRVQLDDGVDRASTSRPMFGEGGPPRQKKSRLFMVIGVTALLTVLVVFAGVFAYYQTLKNTPQYTLALLVDAARRDDKAEMDRLVDINTLVDGFMPQITDKAIELYGRGLPPQTLQKVAVLAQPLLPAVKERARAELPNVIRSRSERFSGVPFFLMVLGADRYFDISVTGDTAVVKSKSSDRPLELKMQRNGGQWQVVGIKDDQLATDIARKIGQELIAIELNGGKGAADKFGIGNLSDMLRQAQELVR